jgi:hypothetical protein
VHDRQRREFEIGKVDVAARLFHECEGLDQHGVARHFAIDAGALIKIEEVRLDVEADAVAGVQQHRFEHRTGGTLAVGAGHHDHGTGELQLHALLDGAHAVEAHVDMGFSMARLDQRQPRGQGGREHSVKCIR